jgi:hypothetical protein
MMMALVGATLSIVLQRNFTLELRGISEVACRGCEVCCRGARDSLQFPGQKKRHCGMTTEASELPPIYRQEGTDTLIEIRLREVRQLFHTLDPAPFREKDLDEAAEQYLLEACREAGTRRPLRLVVYLPPAEARNEAARTLDAAIHNYFSYRERQLRADILRLLRNGFVSFLVGLGFLMLCLGIRRWFLMRPVGVDRSIFSEGVLILGWVAMWRPTEALLYDWWPLAWRRALLRRLATIPVEVRSRL